MFSQEGDTFEELIVDYSKATQIKEQGNVIHEIFNVVIEYGDLIKTSEHASGNKQPISIYGDSKSRAKAKNYIMAISNPEKTESIPINQTLLSKIKNSNQFKTSMIKEYQCNIKIVKEPVLKLVVQGEAQKVALLVATLKKELQEHAQEQASSAAAASASASAITNISAPAISTLTGHLDDDVIWIRDPYEMFHESSKTAAPAKIDATASKNPTPSLATRNQDDKKDAGAVLNPSFPLPIPSTSKNGPTIKTVSASDDLEHLKNVARKQGYSSEEIDSVVKDVDRGLVRPADFLDYLQLGRKTKSAASKMQPLVASNSAAAVSQRNEATTPKPTTSSVTASGSVKDVKTPNFDASNLTMQNLQEYAMLLSNSHESKEERMLRMSKLISAMSDDQKRAALSNISKYATHWGSSNGAANQMTSNKEESGSSEDDEGVESGDLATSPKSPGRVVDPNKTPASSAKKTKKRKKKKAQQQQATASALTGSPLVLHSPRRFMKAFTTDDIETNKNFVSFQENRSLLNKPANQAMAKSPPKRSHQSPSKMVRPSPSSPLKSNRSKSINARENTPVGNGLVGPFDFASRNNKYPLHGGQGQFMDGVEFANSRGPSNLVANQAAASIISTPNNSNLKFIAIDGSNIAIEHGKGFGNRKVFSCKGIKIAVEFFRSRGHTEIKAFVPRFRRGCSDMQVPTIDPEILDELEDQGFLAYTPSRFVNNKLILPYDDRFILKAAHHHNGIIVSNDNYRDLWKENFEWKKLIEKNLLQYSFVGDLFMVADDPLGRQGPSLDQFLRNSLPNSSNQHQQQANNFGNSFPTTGSMPSMFHQPQHVKFAGGNESQRKKANTFSHPPTASDPVALSNHFATLLTNNPESASGTASTNAQAQTRPAEVKPQHGRRPRNDKETWEMYEQLIDMFPDRKQEIFNLLGRYPHEADVSVFATNLLT